MTNAIDEVADELTNGDVKQREVVVSELFAKLRDNTATPNDTPSTDIRCGRLPCIMRIAHICSYYVICLTVY